MVKFFRNTLIRTSDSDIPELSKSFELDIKKLKHEIYQLCWYMRGGVSSDVLFYDTDIEDLEIINKIILENIEATKKSGMPLV